MILLIHSKILTVVVKQRIFLYYTRGEIKERWSISSQRLHGYFMHQLNLHTRIQSS